jgi:hypothetical protein
MQSLLHRSRWESTLYVLFAIFFWGLPGCLCMVQLPEVKQRTLDDIYSTGRLWLKTRELGAHKCTMYGVLETKFTDLNGKPPSEVTPPVDVVYTMDLWYRVKRNETHAMVRPLNVRTLCRFCAWPDVRH